MAKNWKHTKKLLEDLLCDKLKDRITYQLHCYRPDDDWTGHLEILLDKKPIFRAGSCLAKNPNYCVHMSEAEIRRIMMKYLKADSVNGSAGVTLPVSAPLLDSFAPTSVIVSVKNRGESFLKMLW